MEVDEHLKSLSDNFSEKLKNGEFVSLYDVYDSLGFCNDPDPYSDQEIIYELQNHGWKQGFDGLVRREKDVEIIDKGFKFYKE